ncbi:SlyX protein [Cohaesibacter sp. ES.047]|uniref:SlyX family protein n=1 Tax=Cohaesibacter sp. ES.047 TaxID=1798205 RepID=UPI000BB99E4C|nr:SlyX family protein [Cohaesibacter sp. ES.047]SNY92098.1 SlyX protein [Cohaesibacter sp. ES.047]
MSNDFEERIVDLEIQVTHQSKTIDELSEVMSQQWQHIDRLTRQLKGLSDMVVELEENTGPPANQKPPHY